MFSQTNYARLFAVSFVLIGLTSRAEAAMSPCALTINTGLSRSSGAIEILVPLADTDGRKDYRFAATPTICITSAMLSEWKRLRANYFEDTEQWYVTFDPKGNLRKTRSYFDYAVEMCEELSTTPSPPKDVKLGKYYWSPQMRQKSVQVIWDGKFRQTIERNCS